MLKIRLQRVGRKHEPAFRLVLTDSKNSTKSGKFKEILGSYDPRKDVDTIDAPRVKHWLSVGAQASGTAHNLLVTHKIVEAKKRNVLPKKTYTPSAPVEQNDQAPISNEETPKIEAEAEAEVSTDNVEKEVATEVGVEPTPEVQPELAPESAPAEEPTPEEVVQ